MFDKIYARILCFRVLFERKLKDRRANKNFPNQTLLICFSFILFSLFIYFCCVHLFLRTNPKLQISCSSYTYIYFKWNTHRANYGRVFLFFRFFLRLALSIPRILFVLRQLRKWVMVMRVQLICNSEAHKIHRENERTKKNINTNIIFECNNSSVKRATNI